MAQIIDYIRLKFDYYLLILLFRYLLPQYLLYKVLLIPTTRLNKIICIPEIQLIPRISEVSN